MQAAEPTSNGRFFEITTLHYQHLCYIHTKSRFSVRVCSINYMRIKLFNDCTYDTAEENRLPGTHRWRQNTHISRQRYTDLKCKQLNVTLAILCFLYLVHVLPLLLFLLKLYTLFWTLVSYTILLHSPLVLAIICLFSYIPII
jgi:hypothetical protein